MRLREEEPFFTHLITLRLQPPAQCFTAYSKPRHKRTPAFLLGFIEGRSLWQESFIYCFTSQRQAQALEIWRTLLEIEAIHVVNTPLLFFLLLHCFLFFFLLNYPLMFRLPSRNQIHVPYLSSNDSSWKAESGIRCLAPNGLRHKIYTL